MITFSYNGFSDLVQGVLGKPAASDSVFQWLLTPAEMEDAFSKSVIIEQAHHEFLTHVDVGFREMLGVVPPASAYTGVGGSDMYTSMQSALIASQAVWQSQAMEKTCTTGTRENSQARSTIFLSDNSQHVGRGYDTHTTRSEYWFSSFVEDSAVHYHLRMGLPVSSAGQCLNLIRGGGALAAAYFSRFNGIICPFLPSTLSVSVQFDRVY